MLILILLAIAILALFFLNPVVVLVSGLVWLATPLPFWPVIGIGFAVWILAKALF